MGLFSKFKKKEEPLFIFDEKDNQYKAELNGIAFVCDNLKDGYEQYAKDLANAYGQKLTDIIEYMLPDVEEVFEISDVEVIRVSLGKPTIDLDMCRLSYIEHTLDDVHIIDVEFSGVFEKLLCSAIDG